MLVGLINAFRAGLPSERSLSPSDTELSSPEFTVCYDLHGTVEEEEEVAEEEEVSENGQEVLQLQTQTQRAFINVFHFQTLQIVLCTFPLFPFSFILDVDS